MKPSIYILLILLLVYSVIKAGPRSVHTGKAVFYWRIPQSNNDTLQLYTFSDPAAYSACIEEPKAYKITSDKKDSFHFELPDVGSRGSTRFSCALRLKGETFPITAHFYLVEPDDSIDLQIQKLGSGKIQVKYSGRGFEKFSCAKAIDSAFSACNIWNEWNNDNQYYWTLNNFKKTWRQAFSFSVYAILKSYKSQISSEAYRIIQADIEGRMLSNLDIITSRIHLRCNKLQKNNARIVFNHLFHQRAEQIPENYQLLSPVFFNYLMASTASELYREKNENNISLKDIYYKIKTTRKGMTREYLLSAMLWYGNRFHKTLDVLSIDSLWKDAFLIVKEPILNEFILNRITRKSKGRNAFNFSLPDPWNNNIHLADFHGKVILIDFWFTGCGGCLNYSRGLEESVYPAFKDNPDIVFISISGDTNRDTWLQSIHQGKYTRNGNINLYTNGMGFDHPMTKYYDFDGGPNSLLIDKQGKIFSGNPPTNDMNTLIALIKQALTE